VLIVVDRGECRNEISFCLGDNVTVHYNFYGWSVKGAIVHKTYRKVRCRKVHQVIYMCVTISDAK